MVCLGAITVLCFAAVVPAAGLAAVTLMAVQAPADFLRDIYAWCCLTLPAALILMPILAWIAFAWGHARLALALGLAPTLWVMALALYLI